MSKTVVIKRSKNVHKNVSCVSRSELSSSSQNEKVDFFGLIISHPVTVFPSRSRQPLTENGDSLRNYLNVKSPHPNIFKFLEAVGHEQEKTLLKLRCAECPPEKKRRVIREKKEKKDQLLAQYNAGQLEQCDFLQQMALKMLPPVV